LSNIFKSKEIYKKIPVKVNPNKPIVVLRGLYVAGKYRAPYWIDAVLNIKQLSTTRAADVVYYTTREVHQVLDVGVTMTEFDVNISNIVVTKYTVDSTSNWFDIGVTMTKFDVDTSNMSYLKYTTNTQHGYFDIGITMTEFDVETPYESTIINQRQTATRPYWKIIPKPNTQPPGLPVLSLIGVSTTKATITNQ
jgi:hypothetical protein